MASDTRELDRLERSLDDQGTELVRIDEEVVRVDKDLSGHLKECALYRGIIKDEVTSIKRLLWVAIGMLILGLFGICGALIAVLWSVLARKAGI